MTSSSSSSAADLSKIYAVQLELKDWLVPRNDPSRAFDREEYRKHPEAFKSVFAERIAPYTTMLLNGGFWENGCPRLLTTQEMARLQQGLPAHRLLSVVDVGCDWGVSLRC